MWICKNKGPTCKVHLYFFIELTPGFVPSCSQLLHFHTVFKTWPAFLGLTSIILSRRRCWSHGISAKIETWVTKVKICLIKYKDPEFCLPTFGVTFLICLRSLILCINIIFNSPLCYLWYLSSCLSFCIPILSKACEREESYEHKIACLKDQLKDVSEGQ